MQLKEECRHGAKNKGEPLGPPSFLFEPCRGARVGSHRSPILRVRLMKCSIPEQKTEKPIDFCDGVDSPPAGRANPCGSLPARCVPLTWPLRPGVFLIMESL